MPRACRVPSFLIPNSSLLIPNSSLPTPNYTASQRGLNIDKALVGRASEAKIGRAQRCHIRAVDKHIDKPEQLPLSLCAILLNLFVGKARVAPYAIALGYERARQLKYCVRTLHRVAATESNREIVVAHNSHHLLLRHITAGGEIPCLLVMATGTTMAAPRKINRGAQARAVDRRPLDYAHHP